MRDWIYAVVVLVACSSSTTPTPHSTPPPPPTVAMSDAAIAPAAIGTVSVAKLGLQLQAPLDAKIDMGASNVFIHSGEFRLNLFVVDEFSAQTSDAQRALLEHEPGFVKFTAEQPGAKTWRFDYQLARDKVGTVSRINVGHPLDCGIHGVTATVAADVARACASIQKL